MAIDGGPTFPKGGVTYPPLVLEPKTYRFGAAQPNEPGEWCESTFSCMKKGDLVRSTLSTNQATFRVLGIENVSNKDITVRTEEWDSKLPVGDGFIRVEIVPLDSVCYIWRSISPVTPAEEQRAIRKLQELA